MHIIPDPPAGGLHGIDGVPHDISGPPARGPHGIGGVHCPRPECEAGVQCRGGGGQYPTPGGGPHGMDGPPNAGPYDGGQVGGCSPSGDPPYGIIVDA
jgi:hypothetical protein